MTCGSETKVAAHYPLVLCRYLFIIVGLCVFIGAVFKPGISFTSRTHMCGELTTVDISKRVSICGWLQYQRMNGRFLVLRDACGTIQIAVLNAKVSWLIRNSVIVFSQLII